MFLLLLGVAVVGNRDSGDGDAIVVVGVDGRAMVVVALVLALLFVMVAVMALLLAVVVGGGAVAIGGVLDLCLAGFVALRLQ